MRLLLYKRELRNTESFSYPTLKFKSNSKTARFIVEKTYVIFWLTKNIKLAYHFVCVLQCYFSYYHNDWISILIEREKLEFSLKVSPIKKENIVNKTLLIMPFVRIWRGSCLYQVFVQSQNGIIKSNHALICWSPSHDTIWLPTFKLKTIIFRIRGTFTFISNDLEQPQKACLHWAKRFNRKEKKHIHKWFSWFTDNSYSILKLGIAVIK